MPAALRSAPVLFPEDRGRPSARREPLAPVAVNFESRSRSLRSVLQIAAHDSRDESRAPLSTRMPAGRSPARMATPSRVPSIVRRLGWVSLFTDVASDMVYPLLPALLRNFGAAAIWLGAMEGLAEAASAVVKWRIGPVVDRAPRKKPLILAGYALATFARPMIAFATVGLHVVILRALDRVGKGVRGVPRDTLIAESVPKETLATAFAFHRMMDNAGSVVGPIVAFALLRALELPIRVVIMLAVVPGLLSCALVIFAVKEPGSAESVGAADSLAEGPTEGPAAHARAASASEGRQALPAGVRRYLAVLALFTLGASADSFLLLRAVEIGMSEAWAPLLWLALGGAKALSNLPGGWLADRFGRKRTLVFAWLLYACFYAAAPHVTTPLRFALIVIAYGAYYGLAEGSERALLAEQAPPSMRGRAFGAMHAVTGLAVLPANLLFGALYAKHVALAFGASAACAAGAAGLLLVFVKEHQEPPESATLSA
jgi:MFS family permease